MSTGKQVVRCKYCKYFVKEKLICLHLNNRASNIGKPIFGHCFCRYGEKKNDRKEET